MARFLKKNSMNQEAQNVKLKIVQQDENLPQDNYLESQGLLRTSLRLIPQESEHELTYIYINELNKILGTISEQLEQHSGQLEAIRNDMLEWKERSHHFSQKITETQESQQLLQQQTAEHLRLLGQHTALVIEENKQLKNYIQQLQAQPHTQNQDIDVGQDLDLLIELVKNNNNFLKSIQEQQNQHGDLVKHSRKYLVEITWIIVGLFFMIMVGLVFKNY